MVHMLEVGFDSVNPLGCPKNVPRNLQLYLHSWWWGGGLSFPNLPKSI